MGPLFEFHNNGRPIGNGLEFSTRTARTGDTTIFRDWRRRRSNMYDNAPQETRYIYTDYDSSGRAAERIARAGYTVTFPAGQTPPVDGFWSLTALQQGTSL